MRRIIALAFILTFAADARAGILDENQIRTVLPDGMYAPYSSTGPHRPITSVGMPVARF